MNVQNVLDQFELKLIQICYIQIWYIQFCLKIGWFRVNRTRGRNSNTSISPVDRVSCPDTEIRVFPEWEFLWTGFHVGNWNGATNDGQTTVSFFFGRNWNGVTTDRRLYLFFCLVVIGMAQQRHSQYFWETIVIITMLIYRKQERDML